MATINIKGYTVLIDDEDFKLASSFKWWPSSSSSRVYFQTRFSKNEKPVLLHRVITNCPKGLCVDHINHNTLDNRRSNLRICSRSQNNFNSMMKSNNTSGIIGVWFRKDTGKWVAEMKAFKKKIRLGCFETKELARGAYLKEAMRIHGEFISPEVVK